MILSMPDFVMPQKPRFHIRTYVVHMWVGGFAFLVVHGHFIGTCTLAVDSPLALFEVSELPLHSSPTDREGRLKSPF